MKHVILLIAAVSLSSCYGIPSGHSLPSSWEGKWYGDGIRESVLSITGTRNGTYEVRFRYGDVAWEGIGYETERQLLVVFRYRWAKEHGYFTLTRVSRGRADFTSFGPDGRPQSRGMVLREIRN